MSAARPTCAGSGGSKRMHLPPVNQGNRKSRPTSPSSEGSSSPSPHVMPPAPSPTPFGRPPFPVPGCGRPRAVAASRTMSPSRASKGGDCTTQTSEADWGRGTSQAAMCSFAPPLGGVSPAEQSATRPPPSRNGVALPYLRPLTPEAKWTCPSAVCQLPGLCGKMDPPARRRVGSWCLTRPLLPVRLSPGRQENQHPERPVSSSPTHIPGAAKGLSEDPGTPACREWYRQNPPEPSRAPCPTQGGNQTSRHRAAQPPLLFPTLGRDLVLPFSTRASRTASPRAEAS